ncbi:hypothetical protein ACOSP7_029138 [Xanthoceras sorbifolium]
MHAPAPGPGPRVIVYVAEPTFSQFFMVVDGRSFVEWTLDTGDIVNWPAKFLSVAVVEYTNLASVNNPTIPRCY